LVLEIPWAEVVAGVEAAAMVLGKVPVVVQAEVPVELHGIDDACSGMRNKQYN
jgi:hypothetical protein